MQVLKGPQGTLFGRNTLGGAVVVTPEAPTYEVGGYIKGDYGIANYRAVEGALNMPIVDEKVALRIAGQLRRQDPLVKNLTGPDVDDTHQNSVRVSLLLNPIDKLESTTVYDRYIEIEGAGPENLYSVQPGFFPTLQQVQNVGAALGTSSPIYQQTAAFYGLGQVLIPQLNAAKDVQHAAGFWSSSYNLPDAGSSHANTWSLANDTSYDTGVATVRNTASYRRLKQYLALDTANAGYLTVPAPIGPGGSFVYIPFVLYDPEKLVQREYRSDELQVFGNAMDGRLDWIATT